MDFPIYTVSYTHLEKAQINKSTFYAHYQDIYHLSDTLETEVVVSIMENLTHPERVLEDTVFFSRELFLSLIHI